MPIELPDGHTMLDTSEIESVARTSFEAGIRKQIDIWSQKLEHAHEMPAHMAEEHRLIKATVERLLKDWKAGLPSLADAPQD